MLSCNSTKCHCPACNARRKEIEQIADDRIAAERVACNISGERFGHHALRTKHSADLREELKKPPRYDTYVDINVAPKFSDGGIVGCPSGSNLRWIEETRPGTYYSKRAYYDRAANRVYKWKWTRGIGWMKVSRKGMVFGERYRKVMFLSNGFNAWRSRSTTGARPDIVHRDGHGEFAGEGVIGNHGRVSAVEHTETKTVGDISTTTTDRAEYLPHGDVFGWQHQYRWKDGKVEWLGRWKDLQDECTFEPEQCVMANPTRDPSWVQKAFEDKVWVGKSFNLTLDDVSDENLRDAFLGGGAKTGPDAENDPINLEGVTDVISSLKLSILLWRSAHSAPYPIQFATNRQLTREAMAQLARDNLITPGRDIFEYDLAPRGRVLVAAIQNLPLPVQPEPLWVMPKA